MRFLLHFVGEKPTLERIVVCLGESEIIKFTIAVGVRVVAAQDIGSTGVRKGRTGVVKTVCMPDRDGIIYKDARCIDVKFRGIGSVAVSMEEIDAHPNGGFPTPRRRRTLKISGQDSPH